MSKWVLVAFGVVFGGCLLLSAESSRSDELSGTAPGSKHNTETRPTEYITLDEALRRSLNNNPELAAYVSEVEARDNELRQAGYFVNPELSLAMDNFSGSGAFSGTDSAEMTTMLSQTFELGGERRRRVDIGRLDKKIAEQELVSARSLLLATVKRLFIDVQSAQQRLGLANEQAKLAGKVRDAVNERIAAGKAPAIERLRFESLLLESEWRQEQAAQGLISARRALSALWNQEEPDFEGVLGDFRALPAIPDWPDLVSMIDESPGLSLKKIETDRASRQVSFEKAKRVPDVTIGVGRKRFEETGDDALVAGLSISVPIFNRNQGGIGAAQARQAKAHSSLQAARLQLRTDLGHIWQRLQGARSEAALLSDKLLPTVQQSFDATSYGYRVGKFGYLDVLDAEKVLFSTRLRYIETLKMFHETRAELESLLGRNININDRETFSSVVQ